MGDNNTYIVKCVVLGDYGSGKTSILSQYCYNKYKEYSCTTIGVDFFFKQLKKIQQHCECNYEIRPDKRNIEQ